jgi:hypothetical protein
LQWGALVFVLFWFYRNTYRVNCTMTVNKAITSPAIALSQDSMPKSITTRYERCKSADDSITRLYEYNITKNDASLPHWRLHDPSSVESSKHLRGVISLKPGDASQASDIEVRIIIESTSKTDAENVISVQTDSVLSLDYVLAEDEDEDICTQVSIDIFLRPQQEPLLHLSTLEIRSEILDIDIGGSLGWHVDNFITHTSHGENNFEGTRNPDPLITHNVTVSSISGTIFGWYLCDGNLNIHAESSIVVVYLVPTYTFRTERPFNPESISVTTTTGELNVVAMFEYWPVHALNHTTQIHTTSGNLYAQVPHGSLTNLSSLSGNITSYIRTYGALHPDDPSEIHTSSGGGITRLRLDNPEPRSDLEPFYNPLLRTTSSHHVGAGNMLLQYPFSWWGDVAAEVGNGTLLFNASALDKVERGDGYVRAKRGKESRLEARVGTGELELSVGIWDSKPWNDL